MVTLGASLDPETCCTTETKWELLTHSTAHSIPASIDPLIVLPSLPSRSRQVPMSTSILSNHIKLNSNAPAGPIFHVCFHEHRRVLLHSLTYWQDLTATYMLPLAKQDCRLRTLPFIELFTITFDTAQQCNKRPQCNTRCSPSCS